MTVKRIFYSLVVIVVLVLIAYSINYFIIDKVVIGNEYSYDTNNIKTGVIFNLFYVISSDTGYHPEPNNFNFIFTAMTGLSIGGLMSYRLFWRTQKSTNA
jgi:hypothetical protein